MNSKSAATNVSTVDRNDWKCVYRVDKNVDHHIFVTSSSNTVKRLITLASELSNLFKLIKSQHTLGLLLSEQFDCLRVNLIESHSQ